MNFDPNSPHETNLFLIAHAEDCKQTWPEVFLNDPKIAEENANTVWHICRDNGWPLNMQNMEAAIAVATQNGTLKTSAPNVDPLDQHLNARITEDEFIRSAPIPEVEKYLRDTYDKKPAPNIAPFSVSTSTGSSTGLEAPIVADGYSGKLYQWEQPK